MIHAFLKQFFTRKTFYVTILILLLKIHIQHEFFTAKHLVIHTQKVQIQANSLLILSTQFFIYHIFLAISMNYFISK